MKLFQSSLFIAANFAKGDDGSCSTADIDSLTNGSWSCGDAAASGKKCLFVCDEGFTIDQSQPMRNWLRCMNGSWKNKSRFSMSCIEANFELSKSAALEAIEERLDQLQADISSLLPTEESPTTTTAPGPDFDACNANAPSFDVTGGEWKWNGSNWVIECDSESGIPASENLSCDDGEWKQIGPVSCYQPPPMPDFLEAAEIINDVTITCMHEEESYDNWEADGQYAQLLYEESLKYLEGYARALTESDGICRDSDNTMTQTNTHTYGGPEYMCIMDRRDMRLLVKHIYFILYNPNKAKACFGDRGNVGWMYGVGGKLEESSSVAQWLRTKGRVNLDEFYEDVNQVPNDVVREYGSIFAKYFSDMVTGDDVTAPDAFPFDITANALPHLWSSAGWVPMYAWDSERNKKNFLKTRGMYAYAEVLGHWGLIRIDEINGEKVGAEIGMVNQGIETFYPFHNHAIPEIYYTIRKPACAHEFKNFAIRENNPLLETISETDTMREVEFDGSDLRADEFWVPTSPKVDDLIYFHENTIHAFDIEGCDSHAKPEEKAIVTVWARSMAHDRRNDYGTTLLCESSAEPETPANKDELWRCDLTKTKWRRKRRSIMNPFDEE